MVMMNVSCAQIHQWPSGAIDLLPHNLDRSDSTALTLKKQLDRRSWNKCGETNGLFTTLGLL